MSDTAVTVIDALNVLGLIAVALISIYGARRANAAVVVAEQTHLAVNSTMTETLAAITLANEHLLAATAGLAHAEGVAQGEQDERDRQSPLEGTP